MKKSNSILKLSSNILLLAVLFSFSCVTNRDVSKKVVQNLNNQYVQLSIDLMNEVRKGSDAKGIREKLEKVNSDTLASYLITEEQKKAFWINVYNAHIQVILRKNPEYFEDRGKFFGQPLFTIAQKKLSFDDVEHGIIRSSKIKLSLGLLRNPFAGEYEKKFRTRKEDGRIHFALNCGAKSCPLVATYDAKNFNQKIDEVAKNFLNKMSTYSSEDNTVKTTPLFNWFRGDFDGKSGIKKLLKKYDVIPENSDPKIEYNDYDWTLSLGNYYEK